MEVPIGRPTWEICGYSTAWIILAVGAFGHLALTAIALNSMALVAFFKDKKKTGMVYYLTCLSAIDILHMLHLLCAIVLPPVLLLFEAETDYLILFLQIQPYLWGLSCVFQSAGTFTVVMVTVDRYLIVS